jgi:hypothetical protein
MQGRSAAAAVPADSDDLDSKCIQPNMVAQSIVRLPVALGRVRARHPPAFAAAKERRSYSVTCIGRGRLTYNARCFPV